MADENPIPEYLAESFHQAITVCDHWGGDDDSRLIVGVRRNSTRNPEVQSIEKLCAEVSLYADEMPDGTVLLLSNLPYNVSDDVVTDRGYSTGARCLLELIRIKRQRHA